MRLVNRVLDQMLNHILNYRLDYMIIGFVITALYKFLKKILDILKKDFINLNLEKKEIKEFQAYFDKFIQALTFTICFFDSFFLICTIYHTWLAES